MTIFPPRIKIRHILAWLHLEKWWPLLPERRNPFVAI
jgi:hypothetical protein